MPDTLTAGSFTDTAFENFLSGRNEPSWLTERRRQAWQIFQSLDLPAKNHEEWRRTDLRTFRLEKFQLPTNDTSSGKLNDLPAALLAHDVDLGARTWSLNSQPGETQILDESLTSQGVLFGSLDTLVAEHPELVQRWFEKYAIDPATDKFAALNAACWSGGTLLYVPPGVKVEKPFHALSAISSGGVDFNHTIVILDDGAEATLMAETVGPEGSEPGLHCGTIELHLAPKSRLRYVTLQNWGTGVWHFAHQRAFVDELAKLQWTIGALGAKLAKVNQHVMLQGPKAQAQVNGVMFTQNRQHLAYHTLQHHQAPDCTSDLLYKGALQDRSRLVWRGMIKVDVDAQKTNGYQRNDNLMLSDQSRTDSIPGLEIEADDVICTHGATTGRVDEETVFYAQSRGLSRQEATKMIVAGFFQQVFDRITIESVREALAEAIGLRVQALSLTRHDS